jgi:hypothetical protein
MSEIEQLKAGIAVLLKSNSEEVDEYNAGHDAGENEEDIDIARMRYREEHPDRALYDVFDTGYIMGTLLDYDALKSMQGQIERLSEMSVEQMGTIRELNVQLASTPEEMRENAESAWLAGMSGTHYEKLQEARKEIERLRAALEKYANTVNWDFNGDSAEIFRLTPDGYDIAREALKEGGDK